MTTSGDAQKTQELSAAFREKLIEELSPQIVENPRLADVINEQIESLFSQQVSPGTAASSIPNDGGLAGLVGIGPETAAGIDGTQLPQDIDSYDDTVAADRIFAIADLYFAYQHESLGVFRILQKLQEMFQAGTIRLSSGDGAFRLYRFDRRQVLRYTRQQRYQGYCRALGYGNVPMVAGAKPNHQFHPLFTQFITMVGQYWRDKRISDVIREGAMDPSYGSIAQVRRSGLDARNNLKGVSYGHINVLRIEIMQLLDEAFKILGAEDVRKQFGADTAWEVIEEVSRRAFNKQVNASQRHRLALGGRNIIRWLAQSYILKSSQTQFETLLQEIAGDAEDWLTSAKTLGLINPSKAQVIPMHPRSRRGRSPRKRALTS